MEALRFIERQPSKVRQYLLTFREYLLDSSPKMAERYKWNLPFYEYYGMLCYLNPKPDEGLLYVGFPNGAFLADENKSLTGKGKRVRHYLVSLEGYPDFDRFELVLQEAMLYNELARKTRP